MLDLNASMRRIDLFCKLVAPVFISLVDGLSTRTAIWTVLGLNTASMLIEYVAIAHVYHSVPALAKSTTSRGTVTNNTSSDSGHSSPQGIMDRLLEALEPWKEYGASPVFLASFALSLLYMTVLSFGATMVTYLLHSGFDPLQVDEEP